MVCLFLSMPFYAVSGRMFFSRAAPVSLNTTAPGVVTPNHVLFNNPGTLTLHFALALLCAALFLQFLDFSFWLLLLANIANINCMIDSALSVTECWGFCLSVCLTLTVPLMSIRKLAK